MLILCSYCFRTLGHSEELTIGLIGPQRCSLCGTVGEQSQLPGVHAVAGDEAPAARDRCLRLTQSMLQDVVSTGQMLTRSLGQGRRGQKP